MSNPSELRGKLRRKACEALHQNDPSACDCWKGIDCPRQSVTDRIIDAVLEGAASEYDKAAMQAREDKVRNTRRPDGEAFVIYSEQESRCLLVAAEIRQMKQ